MMQNKHRAFLPDDVKQASRGRGFVVASSIFCAESLLPRFSIRFAVAPFEITDVPFEAFFVRVHRFLRLLGSEFS